MDVSNHQIIVFHVLTKMNYLLDANVNKISLRVLTGDAKVKCKFTPKIVPPNVKHVHILILV